MADANKNTHYWGDDETQLMLSLMKEMDIRRFIDGRKKRNGDLFKKIALQLEESGFRRSAEQIRSRWKHLKRCFYLSKKEKLTSGNHRVVCPFGDTLEELLGPWPLSRVENHGVDIKIESLPDATERGSTDSGNDEMASVNRSREETDSDAEESFWLSSTSPSTSRNARKKRRCTPIEQVLQTMTDMQTQWMDQMRASHEREERLVNNILHSNSQMVSALMEGIRGLQNSMAPQSGHTSYDYDELIQVKQE